MPNSTGNWTKIAADIKIQKALVEANKGTAGDIPASDTSTLIALYAACKALNIDEERVLWTIERYAERNELMHTSVSELIQDADWPSLANLIYVDRKELEMVIPKEMSGDIRHMTGILDSLKEEYFEIEEDDQGEPRMWTRSQRAKQERQKVREALHKKEQEIARIKVQIAAREQKLAEKEKLIEKALRGHKRKSSRPLDLKHEEVRHEQFKKLK